MEQMTIAKLYRKAAAMKLVTEPDANAINRARRAFAKNLADPGDCRGDTALLMGLAVAQAHVGINAGWIPETQRIGVQVTKLMERGAIVTIQPTNDIDTENAQGDE